MPCVSRSFLSTNRSQFVQALLLSTLSLDDTEPDAGTSIVPPPSAVSDAAADDSVTPPTNTTTNTTASSGPNEYEAKKLQQQQQEQASNSEPNAQRAATKAKTGSSKPVPDVRTASACGGTSDRRGHRAQPQQPTSKAASREFKVPGDTR